MAILLEEGLEDLPVGELEVQMMLDCIFYFLAKIKKYLSQITCINSQH